MSQPGRFMRDLCYRIALHGGLTAFALGIIGIMYAELASIWLAGSPGIRTQTGAPIPTTDTDGSVAAELRARVPLTMAVLGFAFVAIGEILLHLWRRRRKPPAAPAPVDDAERLLEEILSQVESKQRAEAAASGAATTDPAANEK